MRAERARGRRGIRRRGAGDQVFRSAARSALRNLRGARAAPGRTAAARRAPAGDGRARIPAGDRPSCATPWRSGAACSRTRRGTERTRCLYFAAGSFRRRSAGPDSRLERPDSRIGARCPRRRSRCASSHCWHPCRFRMPVTPRRCCRRTCAHPCLPWRDHRGLGASSWGRERPVEKPWGVPWSNAGPRRRSGSRARGGRTRAGGFRQPRPACSIRRGVLARTSALLAGCARHSRALRGILRATRFFLGRDPAGSGGDRPSSGLREFGRHADPLRRIAGLFE